MCNSVVFNFVTQHVPAFFLIQMFAFEHLPRAIFMLTMCNTFLLNHYLTIHYILRPITLLSSWWYLEGWINFGELVMLREKKRCKRGADFLQRVITYLYLSRENPSYITDIIMKWFV